MTVTADGVHEWTGIIGGGIGDGSGAFIGFPWNTKECFGKANLVPVWAEFDGEPYRGVIANMGSGPCLVVVRQIRDKIGKHAGDSVRVRVWLDTQPRVIEAPEDLATALRDQALSQAAWDKSSPSHRKEFVAWIEEAKRAETRATRVAKAVVMLAEGRRVK